jgi:Tfp pilus assembly protein PilZ
MGEVNISTSATPGKKSELRSSLRFRLDDAVTLVYKKGLLTSLGIGRTNQARAAVNLSEGGILVRSTDRMKSGTKVRVRLEIEKFKDVIDAAGVVCWCFKSANDGSDYYVGIRFSKLPAPAAAKIARLRGYFTSPEYRQRTAHKRRRDPFSLDVKE